MNKILCIVLFVFLSGIQTCTEVSEDQLKGEWREEGGDDIEVPDFILFHTNGRYIVFNDLEGDPVLPIVEKGNWHFSPKDKRIKLTEREIVEPYSTFAKIYGKEQSLVFHIAQFSEKEMHLSYKRGDNDRITDHYTKVERPAASKHIYTDRGSCVKKVDLERPRTLLKVSYNFAAIPGQLVIADQEGREIFNTGMVVTETTQHHEILLADLPEVLEITELSLKINTSYSMLGWTFGVEIY